MINYVVVFEQERNFRSSSVIEKLEEIILIYVY